MALEAQTVSDFLLLGTPTDLTLEALLDIAWNHRHVALHPDLLDQLATSRSVMLEALADGGPVYGVNTGMGYLAGVQLTEEEQLTHQANLFLGRAVGGPPYLDRSEARALLASRLAGFLSGEAGVSPQLCTVLVDRLNDDFIPAIPRTGIGCAGEIIPLAHAFGPLIGIGEILTQDGGVEDAAAALARRGVAPYQPAAKEGIALLAGAPGAIALAVSRWRAARTLYDAALVTWGCAIDALRAPLAPYDPVIAKFANDPLMTQVLTRLNDLLAGSHPDRRPVQAPVSFRVVPQTLTHLLRTLNRLEEDIRRSLAAATDSPAFVDGHFISNGGFHAVGLATSLDLLCIALVQTAELAGQHIHRLLDSRFTGLPDQLTPVPGPRTGLVAVQKRVIGVLNEMRRLAMPATIGLADTSMGQEDAMTFTFEAAGKLRRVEELLRDVLACELLLCRQAWWLRESAVASGLAQCAAAVASAVPPVDEDRPLGSDIASLCALILSGALK